jgi:hypothetical protein
MPHRWKHRPTPSTWGDWGPDDQLGRLNLIGPEQVLKGIAEVQTGRTFCLRGMMGQGNDGMRGGSSFFVLRFQGSPDREQPPPEFWQIRLPSTTAN